ncbi:FGGY family carbohydrate kinase [Isoptericola sp. b441]|uniref:FGGY family carbohydrate kinase n=1 Tax=Actinotalea lenta TaxID=3064654 RepID=A0ABT9DAA4_9CELL|nr:FGGY family carbohydrate kinase [Isoptericola sp. b441]MDO8107840.1 FGGY family carbohydrate kinase [Isoptericola sp. b441]
MRDVYFLGVDSGTQSTKVSLINQSGEVLLSASESLRPMVSRQRGWVEHPEDDLWDSAKAALTKLMASFTGDVSAIKGIGLCSIRCCRVFLKKDGSLAAPVMSWMDVRAYEPFEDDPDIGYTGSTSGYLTFRLTGELKDTIANSYQYQFPVDTDTWTWSEDPEVQATFGIPRAKLLDMGLPGDVLGRVSAAAARETGLPEGLPVVATANDKAVEALGSGLIEPRVALLSLGTYITSMLSGEENLPDGTTYFTNLSSIPHRYLYESTGIRGGMWHISWFKSVIGEDFERSARESGRTVEEVLEVEAAKVPAGSDGLLTLPDWLAPASQLYQKGVMIGFDQRHTRGHMYRSIMEALAMRMKNNLDDMVGDVGTVPEKLIVCGGGSNSPLFMQIVSDVFGIRTVRNRVNGAAGLGAAISVAVATGVYDDFPQAVAAMVHEQDEYNPIPSNRRVYEAINTGVYRDLVPMLEGTLMQMHEAVEAAQE